MSRVLTGRRLVLAIAAAVAVVAGAGGTALALASSAPSHAVSMSRGDQTEAALKVTAGTPFLDVSVGKLGGTLLRVSAPDDAPVRPVLSGSGLIVLSLAGASAPPGSAGSGYVVKVVLNSAVTWSLDLAGGTQRTEADLRGGKVAGVAVTAGSAELDVSLPRPAGTVPLLLAGGGEPVPARPARRRAGPADGGRRRVLRVDRQPAPDRGRGRDGADAARMGRGHGPL